MGDTVGYYELTIFAVMILGFFVSAFLLKIPIGLAMAVGALAGIVVGGKVFPLDDAARHIVEGMFAYFDPILIIASAMIFMFAVEKNGLLKVLSYWTIRLFHRVPMVLLAAITLVIMLPGMLTGSSTAAVLTTGAIMAPVLIHMGIPRDKAGAIIAMAALLGMVAPPVNIPALIIGAGIDLPYVGLDLPLLALTLPAALFTTWGLAGPHCIWNKKGVVGSLEIDPGAAIRHGFKLFIPLIVVVGLLLGERLAPAAINLGLPLIFMIGAVLSLFTGEKISFASVSFDAVRAALPILGILMGVGMFIQVMTLTGARGEVVIQSLQLPRGWFGLYPVIGFSLPLMGSVSSFGAASVLGVPFVLALPTASSLIVLNTACISVIVALGDLMPPTALAGIFAAQVVGEEKYLRVLRWCILPGILIAIQALIVIQYSSFFAGYLVRL